MGFPSGYFWIFMIWMEIESPRNRVSMKNVCLPTSLYTETRFLCLQNHKNLLYKFQGFAVVAQNTPQDIPQASISFSLIVNFWVIDAKAKLSQLITDRLQDDRPAKFWEIPKWWVNLSEICRCFGIFAVGHGSSWRLIQVPRVKLRFTESGGIRKDWLGDRPGVSLLQDRGLSILIKQRFRE